MVTREVGLMSARSLNRWTCLELWDKEALLKVIRFLCILEYMF